MSKSQAWTVETLSNYLPDDYRKLLTFEDYPELIKVSMTKFLYGEEGKKTWGIINKLLKQAGGAWVSEGKMSHWTVQKFQEDTEPHARMQKRLEELRDGFQRLLKDMEEGKI